MKQMSRMFLLLSITVLMAGCKLAVIVVEGGEVQSTGSGTCVAGMICFVDVDDPNFSETFTALPDAGWYFQKWNSGDRFFCGGTTYPTCTLSFQGYEESQGVENMVASSEVFYLMPVFKQSKPITVTDTTVIVNGKEWVQPTNFGGYTYNQLNARCQKGVCSGVLPGSGFDLTGYTWASIQEVSALFNAFGIDPPFTGPFQERESTVAAAEFFEYFTYNTQICCDAGVYGMVRDLPPVEGYGYLASVDYVTDYVTSAKTGRFSNAFQVPGHLGVGAWFWRPVE